MSLSSSFEFSRITRNNILKIVNAHSFEQLQTIPTGFNNNLAWNLGHVIVTQQLLCYKLSNNSMLVSNEMVNKYRKGSSPEGIIEKSELNLLKELAIETVDQLKIDYSKQLFVEFSDYKTSFGLELKSIEDAITFNNLHEALHLGYMFSIRKFL